jgi:hypothetical protein
MLLGYGALTKLFCTVLQINGQCLASRIGSSSSSSSSSSWPSPAYGGPCDQFGALCRMWEVVDFLELEPGAYTVFGVHMAESFPQIVLPILVVKLAAGVSWS